MTAKNNIENCTGVVINLGYECNNKCVFCLNGDRRYGAAANLPEKDIIKTLDTFKTSTSSVIFTGGEPLIKKNFLNILEYAKERFDRVSVWTNMRACSNMEFARNLMAIKPDVHFEISLHSIIPEDHDALTRVAGSWKQTIRGIKNIVKLGNNDITIVFGVFKQNYATLPKAVDFLSSLRIREIDFVLVRKEGYATEIYEDLVPKISNVTPYLFDAFNRCDKYGIKTTITGIPFCCLKNYINRAFELGLFKSKSCGFDSRSVSENGNYGFESERVKFRRKLLKCTKCRYFLVCEGIIDGYVDIYGSKEFVPIEGKRIENVFDLEEEFRSGG